MADITTKKITSVDDTLNISALFVNDNGTLKQIQLSDLINILNGSFIKQFQNAGFHNSIYRGKYLGNAVTSAQYAAIKAGTFDDMYIGDYWTIGGVNYRIAAFDYYLHCGDTDLTAHSVVLVPDTCLANKQMNSTNTTAGAYVGSEMYKTNMNDVKTTIKNAFSGHILKHRIYLNNAVSNGVVSGGIWVDSEIELMNEQMVYGNTIFGNAANGNTIPNKYRVEKTQLPLFALRPDFICIRDWYWLRDVVSASAFAVVTGSGGAIYINASASYGVRPAFCIS